MELYQIAADAMLKRGGVMSADLRQLLQRVFFEARMANERIITAERLEAAARALSGANDAKEALKQRVLDDRMPLLSLLTADPLGMQSSHLSFQEFFAAKALCEEGTRLVSGRLPWEWGVDWANTLRFGEEMGEVFIQGLLRAAGVKGTTLDLGGKISGDRDVTLRVIMLLLKSY